MVARTHLNGTLYVHCLYCYLYTWSKQFEKKKCIYKRGAQPAHESLMQQSNVFHLQKSRMVVGYRRFGTTYRFRLEGSRSPAVQHPRRAKASTYSKGSLRFCNCRTATWILTYFDTDIFNYGYDPIFVTIRN